VRLNPRFINDCPEEPLSAILPRVTPSEHCFRTFIGGLSSGSN
jgi:hypothetical protein